MALVPSSVYFPGRFFPILVPRRFLICVVGPQSKIEKAHGDTRTNDNTQGDHGVTHGKSP